MLPLKQIARQVTLASALLLPVCGFGTAFAASPGGEGVFTGPFSTCFKTGQDKVTEVCGPYEIRWKLWTLVGEPVGSFVVKWDAKEVRIVDPAPRKGSTLYAIGGRVISGELAEAANKSELYIEASVSVTGGAVQLSPVDLAFDTGVAVRSGKGASMNVPGSWNWDKFLLKAGVLGTSPCNKKAPQYISEQNAKAIMKDGNVQLLNIKLCPGTQVNASALESAIDALCRDDNSVNTSLCAKKPQAEKDKEKVQPNAIEDAFAKLDKTDTKKPSNRTATIEDAFTKMETDRAAAIHAAKLENDRRAAEERKRREYEARLAAENAKRQEEQRRLDTVQTRGVVAFRDAVSGLWGYRHPDGSTLLRAQFERAENYSDGLGLVRGDSCGEGIYCFVNASGSIVLRLSKSQTPQSFSEGLALVEDHSEKGKIGFIDREGRYVISPKFAYASSFKNGRAKVKTKTRTEQGAKCGHYVSYYLVGEISVTGEYQSGPTEESEEWGIFCLQKGR